MFPAVFLDRDGVLIENVDRYVRSWSDVVIIPGALNALTRLRSSPYKIIIVTNQSVVGRNIISKEKALDINNRLIQIIQQAGGRIDKTFFCIHAPSSDCDCRKPKPGLILQAASELSIDISRSLIIGDALSDIQAGKNAGIPVNILVQTGRGISQQNMPEAKSLKPFLIFKDIEDAVCALLKEQLSNYFQ